MEFLCVELQTVCIIMIKETLAWVCVKLQVVCIIIWPFSDIVYCNYCNTR